jgi:drug/metabolite transporter (DMT)-like permease
MPSNVWLLYVLMAGLCWGTYVPLIAFGGKNLSAGPAFPFAGRYAAFLCVGVAYVVIAVAFPLVRSFAVGEPIPAKPVGIVFASLAGVAGALGALGVIFATASAGPEDRIYIAPLIFTLAPLLNTVVSLFWHPTADHWLHFGLPEKMPSWMLFVGVVFVGVGAGMILLSKEKMEVPAGKPQAAQSASPVIPPVQ